jgi:hypothetical protein
VEPLIDIVQWRLVFMVDAGKIRVIVGRLEYLMLVLRNLDGTRAGYEEYAKKQADELFHG